MTALKLRLRNAIADKEIIRSIMDYQTQRYGEWQQDHPGQLAVIEAEIQELIKLCNEEDGRQ